MNSRHTEREDSKNSEGSNSGLFAVLNCRTIRIGSHNYSPKEKVLISPNGIRIVAPLVNDISSNVPIELFSKEIVKVLMHSAKGLSVLFLYANQLCGKHIRKRLCMTDSNGPYYNPTADEDIHRRITLLPDGISDDARANLKSIFGSALEELSNKEANEILVKTCPKEVHQTAKMITRANSSQLAALAGKGSNINSSEIRQILIYPPGKGGISINTEDYMCLAQDQFLNDVIIDFYLKYLCHDILSPQQREKTHVFSTFFYKRLTTKPNKPNRSNPHEWDSSLTPAQKRHSRVKSWTKNVNIFEKDYVVVPINENCHWFLAIICFPGLDGCRSLVNDKLVTLQELKKKDKKVVHIGSTTITPMKQDQLSLNSEGDNLSERDEAEAEESDLDMLCSDSENEDESKSIHNKADNDVLSDNKEEPIKQPCILIFDSLAGTSRSRVVATLRDYLTCEYHAKVSTAKVFNKDNIKGSCPKIPQQNNFTDCGLYLLQYVEHFFKHPVTDYHLPIKQLICWFEEIVVTRKREEISALLKKLMTNYNTDLQSLPDITFPTLNGKRIENSELENGDNEGQSGDSTIERDTTSSRETTVSPRPVPTLIVNHLIKSSENIHSAVRKSARFSTDGGQCVSIPIKFSEKLVHIPETFLNKLNNDKRHSDNFNINVSSTSDGSISTDNGSDIDSSFLKNKRIRNVENNDHSKKIKIAKFN